MINNSPTSEVLYDINQIMKLLPHRYPFLLVDQIVEYTPDENIVGLKNVTINEPHFQGHFPDFPIMPGVLIIESLAQVGAIFISLSLGQENKHLVFFRRIDRAKFRKPVFPGQCLRQELTLLKKRGRLWKLKATSQVGSEIVVTAELEAAVRFDE